MADNSTMVPVIAPDGSTGTVPQEQLGNAIKAGGKLGIRMLAPDGTPGTIPADRVHDAIAAGGQLAPPTVAKPAVKMDEVDLAGNPQSNNSMGPAAPDWAVPRGPVADVVADVARGAVKSAAQTLVPGPHRVAQINAATGMAVPSTASPEIQTQGFSEGVGAGIEGIGEFILGNEVAKGIPLLQRAESALKAQKALKVAAEESPLVQQILSLGLKALRTGAVSGAQSYAHDPSPASAATGTAFGVGGELASEAAQYGISKLVPRTLAAAEAARAAAQSQAAEDIEQAASQRRTAAKAFTRIAEETTGKAIGDDLLGLDADNFRDAANQIRDFHDPTYDKIREATKLSQGGNAFDIARNKLAAAKKVLFNPSSVEAAEAAQKVIDSNPVEALFAPDGPAAKAGISSDELKAASDGWRKAAVLDDLHDQIDKAFTEPSAVRKISGKVPEVDPKRFVKATNKAIDSIGKQKLIDAMGRENFDALQTVRQQLDALVDSENYGKNLEQGAREYLRTAGIPAQPSDFNRVGSPVLAGGSLGVLAHLLGATNPVSASIGTTGAVVRWLYTHPDQGVEVLKLVQKGAPLGAQAAKQAVGQPITHIFDPESSTVQPANQQ